MYFATRIIRFILDVYCKNPRALDAMREFLILPSNRLIRLALIIKVAFDTYINIDSKFRLFLLRYYKNSVSQEEGWNKEIISWCKNEAERQNLRPEDYWGGLVLDEMKIQVYIILRYLSPAKYESKKQISTLQYVNLFSM